MSDHELLQMAAKAAGIDVDPDGRFAFPHGLWNPLQDDGDALRLVVRLNICLDRSEVKPAWWAYCDHGDQFFEAIEPHNGDPCAACRRAIVRAAAAIAEAGEGAGRG